MTVTKKNVLMASAGIALAFNFSSCKKDKKDSQTDKLIGEWQFVTIDGDPIAEEDYIATFEFQEDMDFKYCVEEVGNDKYCYSGEWEWGNDAETEVDFTIDNEAIVLKIETLNSDVLEGDLIVDGDITEVTFKKID